MSRYRSFLVVCYGPDGKALKPRVHVTPRGARNLCVFVGVMVDSLRSLYNSEVEWAELATAALSAHERRFWICGGDPYAGHDVCVPPETDPLTYAPVFEAMWELQMLNAVGVTCEEMR